jgi:hypothetical protein
LASPSPQGGDSDSASPSPQLLDALKMSPAFK